MMDDEHLSAGAGRAPHVGEVITPFTHEQRESLRRCLSKLGISTAMERFFIGLGFRGEKLVFYVRHRGTRAELIGLPTLQHVLVTLFRGPSSKPYSQAEPIVEIASSHMLSVPLTGSLAPPQAMPPMQSCTDVVDLERAREAAREISNRRKGSRRL